MSSRRAPLSPWCRGCVVAVGVNDLVIGIVHSHRKGVTSFADVMGGALSDVDEEPPEGGQHEHDEDWGDGAG